MYQTINDLEVYHQKVGKGKDLILLHGWGNDVSSFWGLLDELQDHFTVWLVDLPGFGRSQTPKNGYFVSDYVETVKEFIKINHLKNPHLLGHSLGGRVGIKLAANNPEIIDKLILEDAAGIKPKQDSLKPFIYFGSKIFKVIFPNIFGLKEQIRNKFYKSLEADYLNSGKMTPTLTRILDEDLTSYLPKIKNQTLVLWGENDQAVPVSDGKLMYKKIPNSKLEILEGASHFPHLEKQDMFLYFVKDFLI